MLECTRFKSFSKGYLLGFADIYVEKWGIEILGCKLFQKEGRRWLQLPSTEYEKDGETKYSPLFKFKDENHWKEFVKQAKDAVDEYCAKHSEPMSSGFTDESEEAPF